ncbi:hypothetical protein, partial [Halomonas sp.]
PYSGPAQETNSTPNVEEPFLDASGSFVTFKDILFISSTPPLFIATSFTLLRLSTVPHSYYCFFIG